MNRIIAVSLCLLWTGFARAQQVPTPDAAGWIPLFDGRTLNGWKASGPAGSFKVVDGQIAGDGPRSHLFYVGDAGKGGFKNFEFSAEVMTRPGANSGVYFHTAFQDDGWPEQGFEVQVNNSHRGEGDYQERKKTGSLYGVRNVYKSIVGDNEWFTLAITVQGPRVQIRVNQTLLVDYLEPSPPVQVPNQTGRVLGRGTFALQCHDPASKVFFKNLRVKPLPDDASPGPFVAPQVNDAYIQMLGLQAGNYPLVNFHVHLKGGLTLEEALAVSRQTGVNFGIAVNCGWGFAVTNDAGINAYLDSMKGQPVFIGMQAEGREWVSYFSAAIARFDYVFTDSMTFFNDQGKRMRTWIKDEVEVTDKEVFMDMLVERTVGILGREPIDIYVNPTFLPDVIAKDYDALWTPERMQTVIDAAVRNGVAIEINARFRLPSPAFLKLAKKAGAKFSFGTNNGDRRIGDLDYCLQMVRECGLTWSDLFVPKPDGQKPVQLKGLPKFQPPTPPAREAKADDEQVLFDSRSFEGWRITDFSGRGDVEIGLLSKVSDEPFAKADREPAAILRMGAMLTGISYTNPLPRMNYEVSLDAMRVDGSDFFCGLTFPVADSFCSFIVGGWGGGIVGLSSLDGMDASENSTTKFMSFKTGQWYQVRVRVTPTKIEAWLDQEKVIDVKTADRRISLRTGEIEQSKPFGVAAWQTTAAVKNVQLRKLAP